METTSNTKPINNTNTGWYCPGCRRYHGPNVVTCPESVRAGGPTLFPAQPWTIPPMTPPWMPGTEPSDLLPAHCGVCGIKLDNVMMYSCQNPNCPTGLGPTICLNEEK